MKSISKTYKIISTGSRGNALLLEDCILIDCGVSYKKIKDVYRKIQMVLLTHIHSDHFNKKTISQIAKDRPMVRFGCCEWLVQDLIEAGVSKSNIDVYEPGKVYQYALGDTNIKISPILLYHNVSQCGYRIFINERKYIYATDTNTLDGIKAKDYDIYFVEANYIESEINKKIKAKIETGQYCYEVDAKYNHLSKEKCDEWLLNNMGANSTYVYLHRHIDKEVTKGK